MAEPRRITLQPPAPVQVKKKKKKDTSPHATTFRFEITLGESTDDKCPEYSFADLVKEKLNQDVISDDPFAVQDAAESDKLAAIARSFEEKYTPKQFSKKGRKHNRKWEDYMDLGMGYDENDPFVDNSEAYDELVPSTLTTEFGGFYINSGDLEFRDVSDSEDSHSFTNSLRKKKKNKQKITSDSDEGTDSSSASANRRRKRKLLNGIDDGRKKGDAGFKKPKKIKGPFLKVKKVKTVADIIKQRAIMQANTPKKESNDVTQLTKKQESSIMDAIDSVIGASTQDLDIDINLLEEFGQNSHGEDNKDLDSADEDSDGGESNDTDSPRSELLSNNIPISQLPDDLPKDLLNMVNKIKQEARISVEPKRKFFTDAVNGMLLDIETGSKALPPARRSHIYSHLATHLPCGKETLLKRAKKLYGDKCEQDLQIVMNKLKQVVTKEMTPQLEKYKIQCEVVTASRQAEEANKEDVKSQSDHSSDEDTTKSKTEEKSKSRMPYRKFQWSDQSRALLKEAVQLKMKIHEGLKIRVQNLEDYLQSFLEKEVKPFWPDKWMSIQVLSKESRMDRPIQQANKLQKKFSPNVQKKPVAAVSVAVEKLDLLSNKTNAEVADADIPEIRKMEIANNLERGAVKETDHASSEKLHKSSGMTNKQQPAKTSKPVVRNVAMVSPVIHDNAAAAATQKQKHGDHSYAGVAAAVSVPTASVANPTNPTVSSPSLEFNTHMMSSSFLDSYQKFMSTAALSPPSDNSPIKNTPPSGGSTNQRYSSPSSDAPRAADNIKDSRRGLSVGDIVASVTEHTSQQLLGKPSNQSTSSQQMSALTATERIATDANKDYAKRSLFSSSYFQSKDDDLPVRRSSAEPGEILLNASTVSSVKGHHTKTSPNEKMSNVTSGGFVPTTIPEKHHDLSDYYTQNKPVSSAHQHYHSLLTGQVGLAAEMSGLYSRLSQVRAPSQQSVLKESKSSSQSYMPHTVHYNSKVQDSIVTTASQASRMHSQLLTSSASNAQTLQHHRPKEARATDAMQYLYSLPTYTHVDNVTLQHSVNKQRDVRLESQTQQAASVLQKKRDSFGDSQVQMAFSKLRESASQQQQLHQSGSTKTRESLTPQHQQLHHQQSVTKIRESTSQQQHQSASRVKHGSPRAEHSSSDRRLTPAQTQQVSHSSVSSFYPSQSSAMASSSSSPLSSATLSYAGHPLYGLNQKLPASYPSSLADYTGTSLATPGGSYSRSSSQQQQQQQHLMSMAGLSSGRSLLGSSMPTISDHLLSQIQGMLEGSAQYPVDTGIPHPLMPYPPSTRTSSDSRSSSVDMSSSMAAALSRHTADVQNLFSQLPRGHPQDTPPSGQYPHKPYSGM